MAKKIINLKREVVALDIGTSTICVAVGKSDSSFDKNGLKKDETKIYGTGYQQTLGLKRGTITNLEKFEDSLISAISDAEKESQKSIKSVLVSLPMWMFSFYKIENMISIGQMPVDSIHISGLKSFDSEQFFDSAQEIIHVFPLEYSIDGISGIVDPTGMVGETLTCQYMVLTVKKALLKNISNCFERNNIDVAGYIASIYSTALSVVTDEEFNTSFSILDIGGSISTLATFRNGQPHDIKTINIGSQHITNDIAAVLKTSKQNAERLKVLYGTSSGSSRLSDETLLVSRIDEGGDEHMQNVSKSTLDMIITSRVEELFGRALKDGITTNQKIIITGGGSMLSGLLEFIKTKKWIRTENIRLGKPINVFGSDDIVKTQVFASACGIIKFHEKMDSLKIKTEDSKSIWQKLGAWFSRGI